jgi:lipid-binding SYLF domain-containing protein
MVIQEIEEWNVAGVIVNPEARTALLRGRARGGNAHSSCQLNDEPGASTDASLRAEMLSYSRTRGLFAGVSLEGTSLRPDDDASAEVYGRKVTARQIMRGTTNAVPDAGRRLVDVLQKKAARNASTATR